MVIEKSPPCWCTVSRCRFGWTEPDKFFWYPLGLFPPSKEVGATNPRHWTPSIFGEFFLNPFRPYIFCRSSAHLGIFLAFFQLLSGCITTLRESEWKFAVSLFFLSWRSGYLLDIRQLKWGSWDPSYLSRAWAQSLLVQSSALKWEI